MNYIVVRIFSAMLGAVLVYSSTFLYENEEKKLQSKLEDLWLRLGYAHPVVINAHLAGLQKLIILTARLVNRLYGLSPKSWKFVSTAILLSYGAYLVSESFFLESMAINWPVIGIRLFICFGPIMLSVSYPKYAFVRNGMAVLIVFSLYAILIARFSENQLVNSFIGYTSLLAIAVLTDMYIVGRLIRILDKASNSDRTFEFVKFVVYFVVLSICALALPFIYTFILEQVFSMIGPLGIHSGPIGIRLIYEIPMHAKIQATFVNLISVTPLIFFVVMCIIYFIHKLMWPLTLRFFYNIQRTGFSNHKKTAFVVGVALLSFAISPDLFSVQALAEAFGIKYPRP